MNSYLKKTFRTRNIKKKGLNVQHQKQFIDFICKYLDNNTKKMIKIFPVICVQFSS